MASSQIYVVRDDAMGANFRPGNGSWVVYATDYFFGGHSCWPLMIHLPDAKGPGSFTIDWMGTSIALIGHTPGDNSSQEFQVTIDNLATYTSNTTDTNPQNYMQWYQSPTLDEGQHTITVSNIDGIALDYWITTPGPRTPLTGQTVIIDDNYAGINYAGDWQTSNVHYLTDSIVLRSGLPFQNGTHRTNTTGDSFTFSYSGTNASVYGNLNWDVTGTFVLSYSIDNGPRLSRTLMTNGTGPGGIHEQPNFKFFETGPLDPGSHNISVTLTGCVNQVFILDYILYRPSFANLASMPSLSTLPPTASSPAVGQSRSSMPVSSIVGIVFGVIAGVSILGALVYLCWRRKKRVGWYYDDNGSHTSRLGLPSHAYIIEPFSAPASSAAPHRAPTIRQVDKPMGNFTPTTETSGSSFFAPHASASSGETTSSNSRSSQSRDVKHSLFSIPSGSRRPSVNELRRQIQLLAEQNARLEAERMPPAYGT